MTTPLSRFRTLHLILLMGGIIASAFHAMDRLTAPPSSESAAPADAAIERIEHPGSDRMFLFVVDSLRYETAVDPERMPYLSTVLRPRAAHAKMDTTYDAVTVPALRAAFTGRDRVTVFGFVKNFRHEQEGFSSLFTQLSQRGTGVLVYSDGSFKQFDADLTERRWNEIGDGDEAEQQNRAVVEALEAYLAGERDVVIAHVTYSDHVAHKEGIDGAEYRRQYLAVDDMIRRLDEAIPPNDTFAIIGDHGHDEIGRHMMGLDVPTFAVFRGPAYRPGADLGVIPITATRYMASWGLKVALPGNLPAIAFPEALVVENGLPASYAAIASPDALVETATTGVRSDARLSFTVLVVTLALVASLWFLLVVGGGITAPLFAWATLGLVFFDATLVLGTPVAAVGLGITLARRPGRERTAALLPAVGVVAAAAWGMVLWFARTTVHQIAAEGAPGYELITAAWVLVAVVGSAVAWRYRSAAVTWTLVIIIGVLFYPTVYRYGTVSAMAPLWLCCLLFMAVEHARAVRIGGSRPGLLPVLQLAAVGLLLLPFLLANSVHFHFINWVLPPATWLWGTIDEPLPSALGWTAAFAAKLVIFVRPGRGGRVAMVGIAAAIVVQMAQMSWPGLDPRTGLWVDLGLGVALGAAAVYRSRVDTTSGPDTLRMILAVAALQLLFIHAARLPTAAYLWGDQLLAALVLSARFVTGLRPGSMRSTAYLLLLLFGTVAAGWIALAWTFHRLEWAVLYDWFDAHFVEVNVGMFLPVIVLRYCIPAILVRILLAEAIGDATPYPQRGVLVVGGLKTLTVALVACGIGYHQVHSDVYMEAVQETTIWLITLLPLVWPARGGRRGGGC